MLLFPADLPLSLQMLVQMVRVGLKFKAQSPFIVPAATVLLFFAMNEHVKNISAKTVSKNHK